MMKTQKLLAFFGLDLRQKGDIMNALIEEVSTLKTGVTRIVQRYLALLAKLLTRVFLRPEVQGQENLNKLLELKRKEDTGIIFIANHLSALDPFLIGALMPSSVQKEIFPIIFLGKNELFSNRLKNFAMRLMGCVPIYGYRNIKESIRLIEEKRALFIFPEGRASLDGDFGEDKGALRKIAHFCYFLVQPVKISGITLWRKDWRHIILFKRKLRVGFGVPIFVKQEKNCSLNAVEIIKKI